MATELGDLTAFLDPGITFDARGRDGQVRKYRIPAPSGELGLWCQQMAQLGVRKAVGDMDDLSLAMEALPMPDGHQKDIPFSVAMLGAETHQALIADGVPHEVIEHAARATWVLVVSSSEDAIKFAQSGGRPEVEGPVPNRAEKRAAKKTAPKKAASGSRTTSTARAATTRTPVSGSGTKSPSTRAKPKKALPGATS